MSNAPRKLIVAPTTGHEGITLTRFLVVGLSSALVNITVLVVVFVVFYWLEGLRAAEEVPPPRQITEVEEPPREYDLTNTDIGNDDSVQLNFNVDRIEEVSVPGKVDPDAPVGIIGAHEAVPTNVPAPAGSGGGTGAGILDPNMSGMGSTFGTPGGMGGPGIYGGFGGRSGSTRQKMVTEGGGNKDSEAAVALGLEFLALHQNVEGYWSLNEFHKDARTKPLPAGAKVGDKCTPMTTRENRTAGTAFGLLPFLAAGITHKSKLEKNSKDYRKPVELGVKYLIKKQSVSGADRGYYGGDQYSHAIATIAMCEAYALSVDQGIKGSAQMALDYIKNAQHDGGGWRYAPRQAGDTSVTGWQIMALKSGQMAGLSVPKSVFEKAKRFLDSVETGANTTAKGGYGYVPGAGATPAMTAVGLLCRQYMGVNPKNPSLLKGIDSILRREEADKLKKDYANEQDPGKRRMIETRLNSLYALYPGRTSNIYYEYYATQVMHHMDGDAWQYWNLGPDLNGKGGIRDTLIVRQDKGDNIPGQKGSFAGDEHVGGRLGATSLCLLSLEVYYRHLPLYRRDAGMAAMAEQ